MQRIGRVAAALRQPTASAASTSVPRPAGHLSMEGIPPCVRSLIEFYSSSGDPSILAPALAEDVTLFLPTDSEMRHGRRPVAMTLIALFDAMAGYEVRELLIGSEKLFAIHFEARIESFSTDG